MSADEYLKARAEFDHINREVVTMGEMITAVGSALKSKPGRFSFSNTNKGLPMEAGMSHDSVSFNGDDWRTAELIMDKLAEWHAAHDAVRNAWLAIPGGIRDGLQPPPEQVLPNELRVETEDPNSWARTRRG